MTKNNFLSRFFLLLGLTILYFTASAQTAGWKEELNTKSSGTEKIIYLLDHVKNSLGYGESSLEPLQTAYKLAKESAADTLVARTGYELGKFYQLLGDYTRSSAHLNEARYLFLKAHRFNDLTWVIYWQSVILSQTGQNDSLIGFLDKNKPLIRLGDDKINKVSLEFMYGNAYMALNRNDEAQSVFLKCINIAETIPDTDLIVAACINLGQLYASFDSSMVWYNKALAMVKDRDKGKYAELLGEIGWEYSQRDDAKKDSALYYYLEAEKYIGFVDQPMAKLILYNKAGEFFFQKHEFRLALPYFRKAYEYGKLTGQDYPVLTNNMALIFVGMKQLDSAAYYRDLLSQSIQHSKDDYAWMLYYQLNALYAKAIGDSCSVEMLTNYEKTIEYAIKLNDTRQASEILITDVMDCLINNKNIDKTRKGIAVKILAHCQAIYEMIKTEHKLVNFSRFLGQYAALEETHGDKLTALALYKEIVELQHEISEKKYTAGINEAMVKYKSELKDAEISLLNERNKTATIRTNFILVGMLALAAVVVLIFLLYRRENKNKKELDIRNRKVEELLREIHHRVKNNLQIVSSFINIQLDRVKDRESVQSLQDTSRRIMALAGLHHSLYRQDDFSHIQLDEYIKELCNGIKSTMQLKNTVDIRYDLEKLQLDMDKAIPLGLALNELVTNALKYAFDESKQDAVIVIALHKRNQWELVIKDNGKGMPGQPVDDQRKSIGLRLVQNLVQRQVKGTYTHYNENGAVFKITFNA